MQFGTYKIKAVHKRLEMINTDTVEDLREFLNIKKSEMAEIIGVSRQAYNNFLNKGSMPKIRLISVVAFLLLDAKKEFDEKTDFLMKFYDQI